MAHIKRMVLQGFKSFARRTEIPFDRGINVILGPNGSGKSARWDTRVLLASGEIKPIGEIVEESLKKAKNRDQLDDGVLTFENPLNVKVFGLDPKCMKIKECEVKAFIKRDGEPNLYTIKTRTGKEVTTTSCHPVLVYRGGVIKSEIVQNLKDGDFIATPRELNLPEKDIKFTISGLEQSENYPLETARFLGYLVGDGCVIKDRRTDFVNADEEILEDYADIISKFNLKQSISIKKDSKAKCIYVNSKKLANGLIEFFDGKYKKEGKHIPKEILFSRKEVLANFLGALFDCDSSVRKDNPTFEYVTMSKRLANEVILGLLRFGIVARKTKKDKYAANTINKTKRPYYFITIEGKERLTCLYQNIHLKCDHKRDLLKKWSVYDGISNTNNDLLPGEVNLEIRRLVKLLGIGIKKIRKDYPLLAAYVEDRCNPSRNGLRRILPVFNTRFSQITNGFKEINLDQNELIGLMDLMAISSREISESIGLHKTIIRNQWAKNLFRARIENREKFKQYLVGIYLARNEQIQRTIELLNNLAYSDIFWDKIKAIDKVKGEKYVYDLEIEDTHNFIADEVFVHNSNISDALCFVLGRLSIKSMRAAKARNLIFMGSKYIKAAKEASVEIVFDNSDGKFSIDTDEIIVKRAVRINGQSIYKINGETKTRSDVIETLAQAGIDPYGFNLILQGEIQGIVRMHSEERRKIIEEVAGISIYESRKEKSIKELEKNDARLKEIGTILRERNSYLNSLEKEKSQAQKYQDLKSMSRRVKASILKKKMDDKLKEIESILKVIEEKTGQKDKKRGSGDKLQEQINEFSEKINQINKHIQQATGMEQGRLRDEITNLRASLEGLRVRKEGFEHRKGEIEKRIEEMKKSVPDMEIEIGGMRERSPLMAQKAKDLKKKKEEIAQLEDQRKKMLTVKTEISAMKDRIIDKQKQLARAVAESESLMKQLEELSIVLQYNHEEDCLASLNSLKNTVLEKKKSLEELHSKELENEKIMSLTEAEMARSEDIKAKVSKIDVCPLCQSKMTEAHIHHVFNEADEKINAADKSRENAKKELETIRGQRKSFIKEIEENEKKIYSCERELASHRSIKERKNLLKKSVEYEQILKNEIKDVEEKKNSLENRNLNFGEIEEQYESKMLEIEEISSRTEIDLDTTLLYRERELEKVKSIIERSIQDLKDIEAQIKELTASIKEKKEALAEKEEKENEMQERFQKMFSDRDKLQKEIQEMSINGSTIQNELRQMEDQINYLKIGKAKIESEKETIEIDFGDYAGIELVPGSLNYLEERLSKAEGDLEHIGSINMRALEVYDEVKKEYDSVKEKVDILDKEKIEIMKIIEEIDKKKYRTFMRTFRAINEFFSRNFGRLSTKGASAYLEIDNKEDIFAGGVNIIVRMAKGKYFDVTSLSGGEQTMVALSLLFAIQEYSPYQFYVLDEIDAALDKRNSERLAALLQQYMKAGQYIVITHNDAIILNSQVLYGVSMHEGVSKILSIKLSEEVAAASPEGAVEHADTIEEAVKGNDEILAENIEDQEDDKDLMTPEMMEAERLALGDDGKVISAEPENVESKHGIETVVQEDQEEVEKHEGDKEIASQDADVEKEDDEESEDEKIKEQKD